jgi:hypothetical protein
MLASLALILLGGSPALDPAQQAKPNRAKAIQDGLVWLARHQNDNGSWGGNTLMQHCKGGRPCYQGLDLSSRADTGITGLALLAFLRNGCDPLSKKVLVDPISNEKFVIGELITRGLCWLEKAQKPDGGFEHQDNPTFLYNHALVEMALSEASLLDKTNADWPAAARKGVAWLETAQRKSPGDKGRWGWRYVSRLEIEKDKKAKPEELHDSDVSATGWAIAALSAAARAGLEVHKEAFGGALDFMNSVCVTNGLVGYQKAEHAGLKVEGRDEEYQYHFGTLCALGILIRLNTTKDTTNAFLDSAAKHIVEDQPQVTDSNLAIDYYYWYHGTEALNRLEGSEYAKGKKRKLVEPWNKAVTERLCALQDHTKGACSYGGWVTRDRWSYAGGPVYCTALALLTLDRSDGK